MVDFNGIFKELYDYYGERAFKRHVKISGDVVKGRGLPFTVIDPYFSNSTQNSNWISNDKENSSLTITFTRSKFLLNSYSVRSRLDNNMNHPKEWILEGTDNNFGWTLIHHKPNGTEMVGLKKEISYECQQTKAFNRFRIMQIGKSTHSYSFALSKIEFFGKVYPWDNMCTNRCQMKRNTRCIFFLIISIS